MSSRRGGNLRRKYINRPLQFMEVMEDIYGKEAAGEMSYAQLIARHRDVAEKILGVPRPEYDPFTEKPRIKVLN